MRLLETLTSRLIGQDEVLAEVADLLERVQEGMFFKGQPKASILMLGPTGVGKCLKKGTPVMLYSGMVVPVESIASGDLLMGDDSTPRRVTSTSRGYGKMYRIIPTKGEPWVCNGDHVMTLRYKGKRDRALRKVVNGRVTHIHGIRVPIVPKSEIIDVPLNKFLEKTNPSNLCRNWNLSRVPVEWKENKHSSQLTRDDFYFMGLWMGDGHASGCGVVISNPDTEIREWLKQYAESNGWEYSEKIYGDACPTIRLKQNHRGPSLAPGTAMLRKLGHGKVKTVPHWVMTSPREKRLAFLAGVLDTDGHLAHGCFEITQLVKPIADSICFVSRSLGLWSEVIEVRKGCQTGAAGTYFRQCISGETECIPTIVERKKATARKQIKDVKSVGWKAEPAGEGDYYGFTLDSNGRFLLGDFTVTHNTESALIACNALCGDPETCMARFDMSEFMVPEAIINMLGTPDHTGVFERKWRKTGYGGFILFDEIEKAHSDILNMLLQILSAGRLTVGSGLTLDLSDKVILCTTNIGSRVLMERKDDRWETIRDNTIRVALQELSPELLNRFDLLAVFNKLRYDTMRAITDIHVSEVINIQKELGHNVTVTDAARERIQQVGFSDIFGARPVRREAMKVISRAIRSRKAKQDDLVFGTITYRPATQKIEME